MRSIPSSADKDLQKSLAKIREDYADTLTVPKPAGHLTMMESFKSMVSRSKHVTPRAESNQSMKDIIISPDERGKISLYKVKTIPVQDKQHGHIKVRSFQRVETDKANTILESISAKDAMKSTQLTQIFHNNAMLSATPGQIENKTSNYLGMQNVNINMNCHDLFGLGYLAEGLKGLAQIHSSLLEKLPYWGFIAAIALEFAILSMFIWQLVRLVSLFVMAGTLTHEVSSDTWYFTKTIVQGTAKGIAGVIQYFVG